MPSWNFDTPGAVRLDLELPFGRIEVDTDESATTTRVDLEGSGDVQDLIDTAVVDSRARGTGRISSWTSRSAIGLGATDASRDA